MPVDLDQELNALDTEDYAAFSAARDTEPAGTEEEAPAAGEETKPPSEPADEAGQTETDSETVEEQQDEEEEPQDKKPKDNRLARRMRELSGKIKTLESQLAEKGQPSEDAEEAEEEVVSSPEKVADTAEKLVRPMLKDFEDTDKESAWDQYEKAMEVYNDLKLERKLTAALTEQKEKLELEHGKALADAAWSKAASRFSDYNEVVLNDKVQISQAMESVMRMDAESGTALAYWLGKHPEESLRIAKSTLAGTAQREPTQAEWAEARVRASFELGQIRAQLNEQGKAKEPAKEPPKSPTAAQPPTTKKVTSASKPPTVIRGGTAPPQTDVMSEDDAGDYKKWNRAREAQLKRK